MSAMREMMEKVMEHMVKPEDMPAMMDAMMDRMFSGMSPEDRRRFVSTMMPRCLALVMADMSAAEKDALSRELVEKLIVALRPAGAQSVPAPPGNRVASPNG